VGEEIIPPPGDAGGDNEKARGVTDIRQVAGATPCLQLKVWWSGNEEELERHAKKSKGGAGPWGSGIGRRRLRIFFSLKAVKTYR